MLWGLKGFITKWLLTYFITDPKQEKSIMCFLFYHFCSSLFFIFTILDQMWTIFHHPQLTIWRAAGNYDDNTERDWTECFDTFHVFDIILGVRKEIWAKLFCSPWPPKIKPWKNNPNSYHELGKGKKTKRHYLSNKILSHFCGVLRMELQMVFLLEFYHFYSALDLQIKTMENKIITMLLNISYFATVNFSH